MTALLQVKDLRVEARSPAGLWSPIVKGVSFAVRRREVVALIGASGSGKTTICLAMIGYAKSGCRVAGGHAWLDGTDLLSLDEEHRRRLRGARVAYIPQSAAAAFNPALTIGSQVIEPALIHGTISAREAGRRAEVLYRRLDLPEPERIGRLYPHQLSGGQLQRLMAAMAMTCDPELLLLDEPTTALDVTTQIEVLKAFKEIVHEHGTAAIYVSHDLAVVAQIADRVIVLSDGEMLEEAPIEHILTTPAHSYTRHLISAVRPPPKPRLAAPRTSGITHQGARPPIIELRGVSAGYGKAGGSLVLREVSFALPAGAMVGVIGESGSGKSTLARVIAGLLTPIEGDILCDGTVLPPSVRQRRRSELRRIQIVFQMADVALNPHQRVRELLARPFELFVGGDSARISERIGDVLDLVELPRALIARYPHELSGGQKQRVNLARALIAEPEAILCDEVISSLDTLVGAAILGLLKGLQQRLGLAYLFISHDISTVGAFADHIVVLYAGRVVEQGATRQVLAPPHHPYTKLLLKSVPELRTGWLDQVAADTTQQTSPTRDRDTSGCPFHLRCPMAIRNVCDRQPPPVHQLAGGHRIACHREPVELD